MKTCTKTRIFQPWSEKLYCYFQSEDATPLPPVIAERQCNTEETQQYQLDI